MPSEFSFIGKLCKITEKHCWFVFPTKGYCLATRPMAISVFAKDNCRRLGLLLGCEITYITKGAMFVPLEYHKQERGPLVVKILTREGNISWVDADIKFYLEDVCKDIAT